MKRYLRIIPAIITVSIIWYFSDQPSLKSNFSQVVDIFLRKGAHILEYLVLYLALFLAYSHTRLKNMSQEEFHTLQIPVLTTAFVFALLDEWHQSWIPGRTATPHDIGYDSLGFLVAYLVLFALWWSKTQPNTTSHS